MTDKLNKEVYDQSQAQRRFRFGIKTKNYGIKIILSLILTVIAMGLLVLSGFKDLYMIDIIAAVILVLIIVMWAYES